ncbi:MAG: N-acetylmuramoyl-L-alanine amidase [Chloroflexi bacterium]|nr:N-acetylmuramoyl-L-alanine amidase [Chloroflexota bacterium]MBI3761822.1 N-acetylmuramoyl-L-alanine amidase [Chloroflexota bacterium]
MSDPTPRYSTVLTPGAFEAARHVLVVFCVAAAVATIFTAWSPASILPSQTARQIAIALATRVGANSTAQPATSTPRPAPRIGLVAGHMGNDSGAVCPDGLTEASVNLEVANRVKAALEAAGFQVDLLNEFDDRLVGYKAVALVSIHADSCDFINDQATGFKVASALQSPVPDKAARLVACVQDRYSDRTHMNYHAQSITFDMTAYHAFREIDAQTPAAIIETGFLNLDRKILTEQPDLVAQGVTEGILCYARNEPVP